MGKVMAISFGNKISLYCNPIVWKEKISEKCCTHQFSGRWRKLSYFNIVSFTYQCKVICKLCNCCTLDQYLKYADQIDLTISLKTFHKFIRVITICISFVNLLEVKKINTLNFFNLYACLPMYGNFMLEYISSSVSFKKNIKLLGKDFYFKSKNLCRWMLKTMTFYIVTYHVLLGLIYLFFLLVGKGLRSEECTRFYLLHSFH